MKILHTVELYQPSKGGAQEVVRQLSERMFQAGHDVTVATTKLSNRKAKTINGVKIVEFDIKGKLATEITGEAKKYQNFLINSDFDVVMNYAAQQWATDLTFGVSDHMKGAKVIVPCGYSALRNPKYKKYFDELPAFLKKYDASVYMSQTYQDIEFAQENRLKNIRVIPNGASSEEFADPRPTKDFKKSHGIGSFFILTIGSHTGYKGHEEAMNILKHLPFSATLVIIGDKGDCLESCQQQADRINAANATKKVLLLDLSREQTIDALKSADIFLFLSNIEASPLVLYEAAAAGLPFVASGAGNSAEIAKWTGGGLIARTSFSRDNGFAQASAFSTIGLVTRLRLNRKLREKLGQRGRLNWSKKFTWDKITKQYLDLYEEIVA